HIKILRRMPPEVRLSQALDLTDLARELLEQGIAARHPSYSASQVRRAAFRLLLGDALFSEAYPGAIPLPP
ncbi:MAG: hypothetical protein ABID40_03300, partial [Candidatus Bipolaricaulota bacterium]